MKRALCLLCLLSLVAVAASCVVRSETLTAMLAAADALKREDYQAFEKYVDVEALLEQVVDLSIREMKDHHRFTGAAFGGLVSFSKPILIETTRRNFKFAVEKGLLNRVAPELRELPSSDLLIGLVRVFGVPKSESSYKIIEAQRTADGEHLKMNVKWEDGLWVPLHLTSQKVNGTYRIVKVENLEAIYKKLMR
jgi:hypothetical protein